MSEPILLSANQITSRVRRETLDNREYLVAPVIAIKAGVLNGELVPSGEIGAVPEAWNGIPVPLGHPTARGAFISANSPEIEANRVVGRFWNAQFDGETLRGEIWVDIDKSQRLGGDALEVLKRLEAGDPIEVSSAYFRDTEASSGDLNGTRYAGIAHNLRPDHLALLLHEIGACSWQDGCGTPRVNQAQGGSVIDKKLTVNQDGQNHTGVMVALYPPPADAAALVLSGEGLPEGAQIVPQNELHLTLVYLGDISEMRIDQGELLKRVMYFAENNPIVRGEVSGVGRFNGDHGNGMQPIYASFDSVFLQAFRFWLADMLPYSNSEHGFTPHITLAYVPLAASMPNILPTPRELIFDRIALAWGDQVTLFQLQGMTAETVSSNSQNKFGFSAYVKGAFKTLARALGVKVADEPQTNSTSNPGGQNRTEEESMNKQELIEKLTANSRCPLDKPELEAMSETALAKLEKAVNGGGCGQPAANAQQVKVELPEEVKTTLASLTAFAKSVEDLGGFGAVKAVIDSVQANTAQRKTDLVTELKANERCAFAETDLQAMNLDQLEKLASSLRPANYTGRGGFRGNNAQTGDKVPEPPAILLAKPDTK